MFNKTELMHRREALYTDTLGVLSGLAIVISSLDRQTDSHRVAHSHMG